MRKTELDRRIRAELRAQRLSGFDRWGRIRKRLGWPMFVVGAILFVGTLLENLAGVTVVPFDPHHLFGQVGGLALLATGLAWATASPR